MTAGPEPELNPAEVCRGLLAALDASEGRRQRRKRDTRPDAIGLSLKRELLARATAMAPPAHEFGAWLLGQTLAPDADAPRGAIRAMALDILAEYRLALSSRAFRDWLRAGCPSEDRAASAAPSGD
jgi:hypothetical protein